VKLAFMVLIGFCAVSAAAGLNPNNFSLVEPGYDWLRPSFSSRIGFSYVTSGGRSWATGDYVGTLSFELHPNLSADLDLGYRRFFDFQGGDLNAVLGGLDLDWRPTDDLKLHIHYGGSFPIESMEGL
jgi:hypothetical protein